MRKESRLNMIRHLRRIDLFNLVYRLNNPNLKVQEWIKILNGSLAGKSKRKKGAMGYIEVKVKNSIIRVFQNKGMVTIQIIISKMDYPYKYCINIIKKILKHEKIRKIHTFNEKNISKEHTFGELYKYLDPRLMLKKKAIRLINSGDKIKGVYVMINNELFNIHYEKESKRYKAEARFNLNDLPSVNKKFEELLEVIR